MTANSRQVPLGVLLIALFYCFGALVLLVVAVTNPAEVSVAIAERHGLSPDIGVAILPAVAALALAIAYGLYSLSRWGWFLTVGYLLYFGVVSLALGGWTFLSTGNAEMQVYFGNLIWSAIVVIYLLFRRQRFFG